nr:T9SS type A sorting domain-containing protein [Candidatus Neomarinimicrobiota bacterium]
MEQSFYLANEISVDGISAQYGDVLLSYNDNVLTGSAVIEDGPTTIAVMGRDMTDLTIGFHEVGQTPQFKIYLQNSGEIVELTSSNNAGWTSMSMHQMDRLIGEMPKVVVSEFSFNTPYPNPFNPVTTFSYGLPNEGKVTVTVYNLNGEKVTELLNENQTSGIYNMDWNAGSVSAGVYFINLEVNEINGTKYQQTQKVILLK